ncbi:MAG: carboxypeptidase-like regulatory domain-containing protein, partial [Bacteroidales bacterium]|nr:carboxypeptidase-like regulatory domain-containing protein [Bacteroidales bacterium]
MKISKSLFILLVSMLISINALAQSLYNVRVDDKPLSTVLAAISAQCEYKFVYNNDFIDVSKKVTVNVSEDNFNDLLAKVFAPLGIKYTISGKQIALSIPEPDKIMQQANNKQKSMRTVTGEVTDETGDPLAGAVVYLEGSKLGTYCDLNGRYSFEIPDDPNAELTFDFVGMKQGRAVVGKRSVIDMTLTEDAKMLEQSVVTGYQTISRERSAGAFAKVVGAEVRDQANIHGNILRA